MQRNDPPHSRRARALAALHVAAAAAIAALVITLVAFAPAARAQSPFSPAISVNDDVVTYFEIDQRVRLLQVFRTPGDLPALAREQLIEDKLKLQELARIGLQLTDEGLRAAMEDFATRANLPLDQFLGVLAGAGVAEETFRDFVKVGISWRDLIRSRYGSRVQITPADIDAAIARQGTTTAGIEVLLSEIIIPAPPPQAAQAQATAERIARLTSTAAFEAEARRVSALPSRERGGRLDWLPISNYPPGLRNLLLGLAPGQVTSPIPIPNGVALFQMRAVREVPVAPPAVARIDYALFHLPAGADSGTQAARVVDRIDTCDDLYGVAFGLPPDRLERAERALAEIPADIALELAKLDRNEASSALRRADGGASVVMLCARRFEAAAEVDRTAVENALRSERLGRYADALLADLRAAATITTE